MIERLGQMKPCKHCDSTWHSAFQCPTRRKPMKQSTGLKTTKRMATVGRQGKKTASAVAAWKLTQPAGSDGMWGCHYCLTRVPYLMCEHKESKARRPDLRTDPTNFVAVCAPCNKAKGSKSHDEFCTQCV